MEVIATSTKHEQFVRLLWPRALADVALAYWKRDEESGGFHAGLAGTRRNYNHRRATPGK